MKTPVIRISEAARRAFLDAAANAGGDQLRLEMSQSFEPEPFFGPKAESDIVVEADGISILLDSASAPRADGVSIDFVQGPSGSGFKFENPNKPQGPKQIELKRNCEATVIPGGQQVELSQGERVIVTQALGGSFTVTTEVGQLVRIAARDANALGIEVTQASDVPVESGPFNLEKVIEKLKTVFDPEIPVNVVDLGLVLRVRGAAHPRG